MTEQIVVIYRRTPVSRLSACFVLLRSTSVVLNIVVCIGRVTTKGASIAGSTSLLLFIDGVPWPCHIELRVTLHSKGMHCYRECNKILQPHTPCARSTLAIQDTLFPGSSRYYAVLIIALLLLLLQLLKVHGGMRGVCCEILIHWM